MTEARTHVTSLVTEESQKVCFRFGSDWNLDTVIYLCVLIHYVLYFINTNNALPHFLWNY